MILNLGPLGKGRDKLPPMFTIDGVGYDGKTDETTSKFVYKKTTDSSTGKVNWEIAFLSGCTLSFSRVVDKIDVFLVGGGNAGQNGGWNNTPRAQGGAGGPGGYVLTASGVSVSNNVSYEIEIGAGGSPVSGMGEAGGAGTASKAFGKSSANGSRKSVSNGAEAWNGSYSNAGEAAEGVLSFGDDAEGVTNTRLYKKDQRYGATGGGGGAKYTKDGVSYTASRSVGGDTGGGAGGAASGSEGNNGGNFTVANTGAGGGGASSMITINGSWWDKVGGGGASGIVIIRNAR